MDKASVAIFSARLIASFGVSKVVGNIIDFTTPISYKMSDRMMVGIGKFVLTSIASDMADNYILGVVERIRTQINKK